MKDEKPLPKLTRKQKVFVKELVQNPKQSATQAAKKAYPVKDDNVASSIASENLRKPAVMAHLEKASEQAELAILSVMDSSLRLKKNAAHAGIALTAAKDVLDRVHGKATQKVEQTSTAVTITIDMTKKALPNDVSEGELV